MASTYPGTLDSFATNSTDSTPSATTHPALHNDANDAINKVEAELGTNPSGTYATVLARLDALAITPVVFGQVGSAVIGASGSWRAPAAGTVTRVNLSATGAPAGSNLVVEFKKNGAAAFSTLTMTAGTTTAQTATPNESFASGDLLTVNATSVGSGTAALGVVAQADFSQA
jgi:hypothetical protein